MKESQLTEKLRKYLSFVIQQGGSDLHLVVGEFPIVRIDGTLRRMEQEPMITQDDLVSLSKAILNDVQQGKLENQRDVDFSVEITDGSRFRANMFYQRNMLAIALRYIPNTIRPLEQLGMPNHLYNLTTKSQGLVLVTGPTGHGKSTTLASMIDYVNRNHSGHIITIEDPIEYLHQSDSCLVEQREVYKDTNNFASALKACLRQDADYVLVGEMRDLETISTAMTAAETGHLIFATLHTNDTMQTIDRIIDTFPPFQQTQVRSQLASVLLGVVSQRLLKRIGGGRVPAVEIMLKNTAVENLIRQNQTHQIGVTIETSMDEGMISINRSLAELVRNRVVDKAEAEKYATDQEQFNTNLNRSYANLGG